MDVSNRQLFRIQSFNRGQFSSDEPTVVPQGAASEVVNCFIDKFGKAQQRLGIERTGDDPATLVAEYTFDAGDSTADQGSLDGTDTAMVYTSDGKFGKGASFEQSTSQIQITNNAITNVTNLGDFRLSCWVYVDSDGGSDTGMIVNKFSGTDTGYRLWVSGESASKVYVNFEVGCVTTNALVTTSTQVNLSTWTKIDALYNSDQTLDIFINGVQASYSTDTTGVGTVSNDGSIKLLIGNDSANAAAYDGVIDDFRIYNTTANAAALALSKCYGLTRFRVGSTIDLIYRMSNRDSGAALQRLSSNFLAWSDIDTGFTASQDTNFVIARDSTGNYNLVIGNATDNIHSLQTDETVTDEGNTNTDPPHTREMEWHDNRLFAIDSNGDINFSDILDFQTFDRAANIFRTKTQAKALKTFKEKELIIYEERGIEVLNTDGTTPLTDWSKTVLNEHIEFNSPRTVVNAGNDQIFLARDGVRILSRTTFDKVQAGIISQPVKDIIDTINQDAISNACAWFIDGRYFLAIPTNTNTENDTVLIWDSHAARLAQDLTQGWSVIPTGEWNPAAFTEYEFSDKVVSLVFGDNRALSQAYQVTGNTDIGKAITSYIIGLDHTTDNVREHLFDPIEVVCNGNVSTTVTVYAETDRSGMINLGTIDLSGNAPVLPIALPFDLGGSARARKLFRSRQLKRGRSCRVKLEHSTYNARPTFVEYTVFARPLGVRV